MTIYMCPRLFNGTPFIFQIYSIFLDVNVFLIALAIPSVLSNEPILNFV